MIVSAIAAIGKNRLIGVGGQLPWHLPLEFKHFKQKTMGHTLIVGRKNFESIGNSLPGRHLIIVTRNVNYRQKGCDVVHSFESALAKADERGEQEAFIAGGAAIYALSLPYLHRFYRTLVDIEKTGDVYFPEYEHYDWNCLESFSVEARKDNPLAWKYDLLEKRPEKTSY